MALVARGQEQGLAFPFSSSPSEQKPVLRYSGHSLLPTHCSSSYGWASRESPVSRRRLTLFSQQDSTDHILPCCRKCSLALKNFGVSRLTLLYAWSHRPQGQLRLPPSQGWCVLFDGVARRRMIQGGFENYKQPVVIKASQKIKVQVYILRSLQHTGRP